MALDPRISLAVQVPRVSQALDIFERNRTGIANREIQRAQEERALALDPFKRQQLQQGIDINQQTLESNRQQQRLLNIHQTGQRLKPLLDAGDTQGAQQFLLDNIAQIQTRIEQGSGEDVTESMETLAKLQAGDVQGVLGDINAVAGLVNQASGRGASAGQREFTNLLSIAQDPNATELERDSANRALGNLARAGTSAQERIAASPEATQQVATSVAAIEGAKEGAKEEAKLTKQLKHKPAITRAIKLAEKSAAERGEVLTDLARMESSLPGLKEAVSELLELSTAASSTLLGRGFDFLVKESGFGSTKGADARAKLIAIVDNQVLPLLKETFGAAFTVQEGENLKASLVDPDASPSQKREQLTAFIDQKERNIRTKQAQLGQDQSTTQQFTEGQTATGPNGEKIVFRNGNWVNL